MHCTLCFSSVFRTLNHVNRTKCLTGQLPALYQYNVYKFGQYCCSKIICTDIKLQAPPKDIYLAKREANSLLLTPLFIEDCPCDSDSKYLTKSPPSSLQFLEELLWTKELKDVLSQSSLSYDVNLLESYPGCFPVTSAYSFEDVYQNHFKKHTLNCNRVYFGSNSHPQENEAGKATEEQLLKMINKLTDSLLDFFERSFDWSLYHKNMIFQNNIKGVTIKGRSSYVQAMTLLKFVGSVQFSKIGVEILKITHHTDDGTIRVRWRVKGLPRTKLLLHFLKFKFQSVSDLLKEETQWLDGFSVFSVGADGLINKHVCDKITPDEGMIESKSGDLKSRILGLLDLGPRGPAPANLQALFPCYSVPKKLT